MLSSSSTVRHSSRMIEKRKSVVVALLGIDSKKSRKESEMKRALKSDCDEVKQKKSSPIQRKRKIKRIEDNNYSDKVKFENSVSSSVNQVLQNDDLYKDNFDFSSSSSIINQSFIQKSFNESNDVHTSSSATKLQDVRESANKKDIDSDNMPPVTPIINMHMSQNLQRLISSLPKTRLVGIVRKTENFVIVDETKESLEEGEEGDDLHLKLAMKNEKIINIPSTGNKRRKEYEPCKSEKSLNHREVKIECDRKHYKFRKDQMDNHYEPCTSDDISRLIRSKTGRALPVPQLIIGRELKEIVDNLEPKDQMEDHVICIESGKQSVMHCKHCNDVINNQHEFRRHIKVHADVNYTPFHCPFCDYKAQIRAQIARHINIHSNTKAYVCKECGRGFNFKQKLQIHMKYHEDIRDQECLICQLSFHEFKTLKNHMIKIHNIKNVPTKRIKKLTTTVAKKCKDGNNDDVLLVEQEKKRERATDDDDVLIDDDDKMILFDTVDNMTFTGDKMIVKTEEDDLDSTKTLIKFLDVLSSEKMQINGEENVRDVAIVKDDSPFLSFDQKLLRESDDVMDEIIKSSHEILDANERKVRKRGIIGTRKTIFQTKLFQMKRNGEGDSLLVLKNGHENRKNVLLGSSKRFVNNQKAVNANDVSSELKEYCDIFNNHPDFPNFKVIFICKVCQASEKKSIFPSMSQFNRHLESYHPDIKAWHCLQCNYKCRLKTSLIIHSKTHSTVKSDICDVCGKAFSSKQKLMSHNRHHLNKREFICKLCNKGFNERNHLKKHLINVHTNERPCECHICGKNFKRSLNLKRHMEVHLNTQKFECHYCFKIYKTHMSLLQHIKSHKCIFHCEICNKNFGSYSGFMAHKAMHNESSTGYLCRICQKILHTKGSLFRHMNMVHSNQRNFACDLCTKSYKSKKDLQMHRNVHTPNKSFVCIVCGYGCKRANSLSVHMRRHYTVKPYECAICHKEYTQKQSVETHIVTHVSYDLVKCWLCDGRKFNSSLELKKHYQVEHCLQKKSSSRTMIAKYEEVKLEDDASMKDLYACQECNLMFSTQDTLAGHILIKHMKHGSANQMEEHLVPFSSSNHSETVDEGAVDETLLQAPDAVLQFEVTTDLDGYNTGPSVVDRTEQNSEVNDFTSQVIFI